MGGGKSTLGHLTKLVESLQSLQIQDRGQTVQFKVGSATEDVDSTHSNQSHDYQSKTDCKTWASEESIIALYLTSILSVRRCRVVTV